MRILIELPSWLGDSVMVTPAIENLIQFHIDAEVTLVGSEILPYKVYKELNKEIKPCI